MRDVFELFRCITDTTYLSISSTLVNVPSPYHCVYNNNNNNNNVEVSKPATFVT